LTAADIVVVWRVGPSSEPGKIEVVLAQKCERSLKYDSFVSIASTVSGDAEKKEEVGAAVQQLNKMFRCNVSSSAES